MYLSPYLLKTEEPIKNRLFFYPWQDFFGDKKQSTITLDIVRNSSGTHSLISCPIWEKFPFWPELPNICKHIFLFMEIAGWANKDNAFWYTLWWEPKIWVDQLTFQENWDDQTENSLTLDDTPFNLTEIKKVKLLKDKYFINKDQITDKEKEPAEIKEKSS